MTQTIIIEAKHNFTALPNRNPVFVQAQGFMNAGARTPFPPVELKYGAKRIYNQPRQCGDWYAEIEYPEATVSAIAATQHDALVAVAAKVSA